MKSQYFTKGLFTLILFVLMISCSKDEDGFMTSGEVNAQKIQNVIAVEKPYFVKIFEFQWNSVYEENRWETIENGTTDFEVIGSFIRIGNYYYNLEKLHKYRMEGGDLELYLNI